MCPAFDITCRRLAADDTLKDNMPKCGKWLQTPLALSRGYLPEPSKVHAFGIAMGSPVSVTVVYLITKGMVLSSYSSPLPRFWKIHRQYVCSSTHQILTALHKHLNSIDIHKFTVERRKVVVCHFWMPCWPTSLTVPPLERHTDKNLHFSSHHPFAHKNHNTSTALFSIIERKKTVT